MVANHRGERRERRDGMGRRHGAQWLSCLELTGCHLGLPIDFNVKLLQDGIPRLVNELKE
jgi:hypothetical protein